MDQNGDINSLLVQRTSEQLQNKPSRSRLKEIQVLVDFNTLYVQQVWVVLVDVGSSIREVQLLHIDTSALCSLKKQLYTVGLKKAESLKTRVWLCCRKSLQQEQPKFGFSVFIDDAFVSQCWPSLRVALAFALCLAALALVGGFLVDCAGWIGGRAHRWEKNHYDWLFSWANQLRRNGKRKDASQDFNYRQTKRRCHSPFKSDILLMGSFKPVLVRRVQIWHTYTVLSWQQCIGTHAELERTSWLVVSCKTDDFSRGHKKKFFAVTLKPDSVKQVSVCSQK